jgi:SAM-dependent methyltransferase
MTEVRVGAANYTRKPAETRAGRLADAISLVFDRFWRSGFRSGWTCLKVNTVNAFIAAMNAFKFDRVHCPVCNWRGWAFRHLDCGKFAVPNAQCPHCSCHERHRMLHLFLERRRPGFLSGAGYVLHFAPEHMVYYAVTANPALRYFAFDIDLSYYPLPLRPGATMDLHHVPLADNVAVGLFCHHVLEHVRDDRACIQEMHRVLKPGGEAVIMVPFMMDQAETEEYGKPDPDMFDHVRGYSPVDFKHRLAPFEYEELLPAAFMTPDEAKRFNIPDSQVIYLCRKK